MQIAYQIKPAKVFAPQSPEEHLWIANFPKQTIRSSDQFASNYNPIQ